MYHSKENCEKWFKNPLVNPITGKKIQENKGVYNALKKGCAQYEIESIKLDVEKKRVEKRVEKRV